MYDKQSWERWGRISFIRERVESIFEAAVFMRSMNSPNDRCSLGTRNVTEHMIRVFFVCSWEHLIMHLKCIKDMDANKNEHRFNVTCQQEKRNAD